MPKTALTSSRRTQTMPASQCAENEIKLHTENITVQNSRMLVTYPLAKNDESEIEMTFYGTN